MSLKASESDLLLQTDTYLEFIDQVSHGLSFDEEKLTFLFSPDLKKVLNNETFTTSKDAFIDDLKAVYQNTGGWTVNVVEKIVSVASNKVVLRLLLDIKNSGIYTAIVILKFNEKGLLTEINEVLTTAKGEYQF